jgi:hypothetical protein
LKLQSAVLRYIICLAWGGLITVGIVWGFIGFSLHSAVGKYALYCALFLQLSSLFAIDFTERKENKSGTAYTPSRQMIRFHRIASLLWVIGAIFLLASLGLMLLGLEPSAPWVRYLCIPGVILAPIGWLGLLMCYRRKKSARLALLKNVETVSN